MKVFAALTQAWAERRKVRITYSMERTFERVVWPLFIEPTLSSHSCYLVAYDPTARASRSYRLDRISGVELLDERFTAPPGLSLSALFDKAWGIWTSHKPVEVVLRFSTAVARRVQETTWHPSQTLKPTSDGGVEMRMQVSATIELQSWVLGWGSACEVIAPDAFREAVAAEARTLARRYESTKIPSNLESPTSAITRLRGPSTPRARRTHPPGRPGRLAEST